MKIKLTVELDLKVEGFSEQELRQMLFYEYINAVACHHVDAMLLTTQGRLHESDHPGYVASMEYHTAWATAAKTAVWDFTHD